MNVKKKEPISGFDEAKLSELQEPIAVTIHKMIGGKPCPIVMPIKDGQEVPGRGLTHDEVRCLDSFIAQELSGGGDYVITATGEAGGQFQWKSYFPLDRYPEIPAPMTGPAARAAQAQNGGRAAPLVTQSFGGGMVVEPPQPSYMPPQPGWMSMPQMQTFQQSRQAQAPFWSYPQAQAFSLPQSAQDDKLALEREARLKLEAQIERERQDAAHRQQLQTLRDELKEIRQAASENGHRRSSDDDAVAQLRRQNEDLQRRLEAGEERRREDERFAQLQRQIEQQSQQFQTLMAKMAERPAGPDPTMMLLVEAQKAQAEAQREAARLSAEAQKETARIQAEAAKDAARSQLGAREMIEVMTRLAPNHDRTADAFGKIMDLQTRVMENALQMQGPQTHPALEMAGRAAEGILGVAQQYIQMKEQATKQDAQAKVATAQMAVQAQAIQAQQAQLAASAAAPAAEGEAEGDDEDDEATELEEKLFGPALPQVEKLRDLITGGQIDPTQAAQAVIQGIQHFAAKKEPVEAFGLWHQGNIAELVACLVPDALDSYKGQMAQALFDARSQART